MWQFLQLEWRVERLWSTLLNNKYCSLAELVLRGELDDVLEGISEKERPDDDYITRLKYFQELIALGKEFLDIVNAHVHRAIEEIQNPYPAVEPESRIYMPAIEIPIEE